MPKIEKFLRMPYWDREQETEYLEKHIADVPNSLLFVYGPKSSGKSTTMMKIISESKSDKVFFYYDLRSKFIVNYQDFLNKFFIEKSGKKELAETILKIGLKKINLFEVSKDLMEKIKNKDVDEFKIMEKQLEKLKEKGKKPIIVIDELQMLKDIYFNGEKTLLKKLFNFFVTITKSKHLANVICMSSDSLFIDEIYNNSILEKTSDFYLFNSFDKKTTVEWLLTEGKDKKTAESVFDKLGGECWYLQQYLRDEKRMNEIINLKESNLYSYLRFQNKEKREKIIKFFEYFKKQEFINSESFEFDENIMRELVNAEILFYDPLNKLIKPQSRLMLNVLRRVL